MMNVAYLGPEGSYTHIAAKNIFGKNLSGLGSITSIITEIEKGNYDTAVVPVENSIAGGVSETIDALLKTENTYVINEYVLPINHCLLARKNHQIDKNFSNIRTVRANQITFNQCSNFIHSHFPQAELLPAHSNSAAAKWLKETSEDSAHLAVIASKLCADIYDLEILQETINDEDINETRFWILSKKPAAKISDKNKSTIVFRTIDEPGSLQTILRLFAVNHVNLSRIESRPGRRNMGEYMFLIDFDLHKEDPKYDELMRQASRHFTYCKWLGSYSKI